MASSSTSPASGRSKSPGEVVEYAQYIEDQLRRTRSQVRWVDASQRLLTLATGALIFLLVAALADHLIPGGLSFWPRVLLCLVFLASCGSYFAIKVLPTLLRSINPVYAAHTIERSRPTLKNSLVNFLLLRGERSRMPSVIYQAIEQKAATDLSGVHLETAIDRTDVIRVGYMLLAVVVVFCLYTLISPKSPIQSVGRVLFPWAELAPATRVTISEIKPGDATKFNGDYLNVSAVVQGIRADEDVAVFFTTTDGQSVDRPVAMNLPQGTYRHQAELPPGEGGLQQTLEYYIAAGDAVSPRYKVRVISSPVIDVEGIDYDYPAYTGLENVSVAYRGDIQALEGTEITVRAKANQPIASAFIDLGCDEKLDVPLDINGLQARGKFKLSLKKDGKPEFDRYQLRFTNRDGERDLHPIRHRIEVTADLPPQISFTAPENDDVAVPENGAVTLAVKAEDPDFALREVILSFQRETGSERKQLLDEVRLLEETRPGEFTGSRVVEIAKLGVKAGETVLYWAEARDNRQPEANRNRTVEYKLRITAPVDAKRQQEQLADAQKEQQQLKEPDKGQQGQKQPGKQQQPGEQQPGEQNQQAPPDAQGQQAGNDSQQPGEQQGDQSEPISQDSPGDAFEEILKHRDKQQEQQQKNDGQEEQQQDPKQQEKQQPEQGSQQGQQKQEGGQESKSSGSQQQSGDGGKPQQKESGSPQSGGEQEQPGQEGSQQGGEKSQNGKQQQSGSGQKSESGAQGGQGQTESEQSKQDGQQPMGSGSEQQQPGKGAGQGEQDASSQPPGKQASKSDPENGGKQGGDKSKAEGGEQQNGNQQDGQTSGAGQPKQPGKRPQDGDPMNGGQSGQKQPAGEKQSADEQHGGEKQQGGEKQPAGEKQTGGEEQAGGETQQGGEKQSGGKSAQNQSSKPQPGASPSPDGKTDENGSADKNENKQGSSGGPGKQSPQSPDPNQKQPNPNAQGQGDKAQSASGRPEDPKGPSQTPQDKNATGGEPSAPKGESGAGEPSKGNPSPSPQGDSKARDKQQTSEAGEKPQDKGESASSPTNSNKESDSKSETEGDRSGGGKQGGGQKGKQPGTGGAGENTASEQGASQSNEPGDGETSGKAGNQAEANRPTGQAGEKQGSGNTSREGGSKQGEGQPSSNANGGQSPSSASQGQTPGKSPAGGDNAQRGGAGQEAVDPQTDENRAASREGLGGAAGNEGDDSGTGQDIGADNPNLKYANQATDLALRHLKDQLEKKQPDQDLLDRLGWSREDLEKFVARWEQMKQQAKAPGTEGDEARQRLKDALDSLGLRPRATAQKSRQGGDDQINNLRESRRSAPPAEFAEQFRAYTQGTSKAPKKE